MWKKSFFLLLFIPALAFAEDCKGEKLLHRLWKDMQKNQVEAIKEYTSKKFQSVHYDGARNRRQELELIANLHMGSYVLSDVKITKTKNAYIITYYAEVTETVNNAQVSTKTPRLTVFEKISGQWQWVAHASLVTPVL